MRDKDALKKRDVVLDVEDGEEWRREDRCGLRVRVRCGNGMAFSLARSLASTSPSGPQPRLNDTPPTNVPMGLFPTDVGYATDPTATNGEPALVAAS